MAKKKCACPHDHDVKVASSQSAVVTPETNAEPPAAQESAGTNPVPTATEPVITANAPAATQPAPTTAAELRDVMVAIPLSMLEAYMNTHIIDPNLEGDNIRIGMLTTLNMTTIRDKSIGRRESYYKFMDQKPLIQKLFDDAIRADAATTLEPAKRDHLRHLYTEIIQPLIQQTVNNPAPFNMESLELFCKASGATTNAARFMIRFCRIGGVDRDLPDPDTYVAPPAMTHEERGKFLMDLQAQQNANPEQAAH